ncbi:solute carrier family 35 member F3-like [Rhinoraja longicauda]
MFWLIGADNSSHQPSSGRLQGASLGLIVLPLVPQMALKVHPSSPPFSTDNRACSRLLGEDGFSCRGLLTRTGPFCILWTLTIYLYLLALGYVSPTEASALFCCNEAFVFLLSWIMLKDRFMGVRIVAAILSVTGIVLTTYADGFHRDSILGVALVVASASASALYKVMFRLLLGPARFGEAMLFLTAMGAFSLAFLSWVSALLFAMQVEPWPSAALVPWGLLFGLAALLLVFNALINCGTAVSSPALVSLGVFLSVPANAVTDPFTSVDVFRGSGPEMGQLRLLALLVICLAFLLLLLPEDWDAAAHGLLAKLRGRMAAEEPGPDSGEV